MTEVKFEQLSPRGNATIDTSNLRIATDGKLFLRSGDASVPVSDEVEAALKAHFGPLLTDAQAAVKALA